MRLSDGSDIGLSYETIAPADHSLGPCPEGYIWYNHIRRWTSPGSREPKYRQEWALARLPESIDQVSTVIGIVRGVGDLIWWQGAYLSELTEDNFAFPEEEWIAVAEWLASPGITEFKTKALEKCQEQHAANVIAGRRKCVTFHVDKKERNE